jgi:hypothetical protein
VARAKLSTTRHFAKELRMSLDSVRACSVEFLYITSQAFPMPVIKLLILRLVP